MRIDEKTYNTYVWQIEYSLNKEMQAKFKEVIDYRVGQANDSGEERAMEYEAKIETLTAENAVAKEKIALLYAELEKAHDINFDLIETVAQLSEKLPEDDDLNDEDPSIY